MYTNKNPAPIVQVIPCAFLSVSIACARLEVGVTSRWHRLVDTEERYCITQGKELIEAGELKPQEFVIGDVVLIPDMCKQRISNIGTEDLIFLAICTPPFCQLNYENIDDSI